MPFAGNGEKHIPTELSVEFEMNGGVHIYSLSLNTERVLEESLQLKSLTKERTTIKKLFTRSWDAKLEKYLLEDKSFGLTEDYWSSADLGNTSVITAASRFGHKHAHQIVSYWRCLETNVEVDDRFIHSRYGAYQALRYYEGHADSKKQAEEDVRRYADLGIEGFGEGGVIKHKFGDGTFDLDFEYESSGTHHYIALRRMMDDALERGGIVVVDEFDAFLHPFMFQSLVKKFLDPKINKGHAQLLMSAQDLLILNTLDKYQINFAKKSERGATSIRRLDRIKKGIRPDDNFLAKYMKSVYGSWPVELPID
jgi:predicted ATPase